VLKNAIKNLLSQLSSAAAANGDLNVSIIRFLRVDVWMVPLLNRLTILSMLLRLWRCIFKFTLTWMAEKPGKCGLGQRLTSCIAWW
jgi:hypothetical protein